MAELREGLAHPATRDDLFTRFVLAMMVLLVLFGAGTTVLVIALHDSNLAAKTINTFASMFTGILGLGSGYLLGRGANGNGNGKK